jgi:hypothetical protein
MGDKIARCGHIGEGMSLPPDFHVDPGGDFRRIVGAEQNSRRIGPAVGQQRRARRTGHQPLRRGDVYRQSGGNMAIHQNTASGAGQKDQQREKVTHLSLFYRVYAWIWLLRALTACRPAFLDLVEKAAERI